MITNLESIKFTRDYWLILLPLICAVADIVTGWIQATVNGTWDSTKMRKGLYRKGGELLAVLLTWVICIALVLPMDVTTFVAAYIVIMEVVSVIENLDQAGVPMPSWLTHKLQKVAKDLDEGDEKPLPEGHTTVAYHRKE